MARRTPRKTKRPGRPTVLTERTADAIVEHVAEGNHITTACAAVGVGQSTLYRWLERANEVEEALEAGEQVDPDALGFVEFRDRLADARARAEMRAVRVVERSMAGGFVISEKPLQDMDGQPIRDDNGEILYERTYSQPDGRLALQYLARSRPDQWGQNPTSRVELSGVGGGPVQVEHSAEHIGGLADRLALVAAQRREEDEEDGEVYEAELVDG